MSSSLMIRPDRQDTRVLRDLLAPGGGPRLASGPPLGAVVLDAPIALGVPEFADTAADSGVRTIVDPMTFALQAPPSPTAPFAAVPYASHARVNPRELNATAVAEEVVAFEVDHGAAVVVPPYFHLSQLGDGWLDVTTACLRTTAEFCRTNNVGMDLMPILSGNRRTLASPAGLEATQAFVRAARDNGAAAVALCLSPTGKPDDSYASIATVAAILDAARAGGAPVVIWRQGAYGLLLSALGGAAYETGIGEFESTDIAGAQRSVRAHKPLGDDEDFRRPRRPVYFSSIGRSVPFKAAEVLMRSSDIQGELLCNTPGCCATVEDTLARQRIHAARTRSFQLEELRQQPDAWRKQSLASSLRAAAGTARRANDVLETAGEKYRLPVANLVAQIEYLEFRIETTRRSA